MALEQLFEGGWVRTVTDVFGEGVPEGGGGYGKGSVAPGVVLGPGRV